jgi:hypothetical protein
MTASFDSPEPEGATDPARSASIDTVRADAGTRRVGVLSTHNSKESKAILNAVRMLGHEPVWIRDENVTSWIEDGALQLSARVDVLVNRLLLIRSDHRLECLQLAALYDETTPVLNQPQAVANALYRYRAGAKLAAAGLPVPDALFGRSPPTFEEWPEYLPDAAAHNTETRPLVDVDLCLNGRRRTVTASITDRSEMTYLVPFGRDVLEAYTPDISQTVEE